MLLCSIDDIEADVTVGASVLHPLRPEVELIRPGVKLEQNLINRLSSLGVREVWIHHDATEDVDAAFSESLTQNRQKVYSTLCNDFKKMADSTICSGRITDYKKTMRGLIEALLTSNKFAGMTEQLHSDENEIFSHSSNVTYLAMLVGLELEDYIRKQRKLLPPAYACDLTSLGVGAMLHDIAKTKLSPETQQHHDVDTSEDKPEPEDYRDHAHVGYEMMRESKAPPSARQIVLCHHQRFDGRGFPDMAIATNSRIEGTQSGERIHIFCRIVAVANALDHLIGRTKAEGLPLIAAMHGLLQSQFDGWFDPVVLNRVISHIPPFPVGSNVRLSNEKPAVVIRPSAYFPCHPLIRLIADSDRADDGKYPIIDLSDKPDLYIVSCTGVDITPWIYELPNVPIRKVRQSA